MSLSPRRRGRAKTAPTTPAPAPSTANNAAAWTVPEPPPGALDPARGGGGVRVLVERDGKPYLTSALARPRTALVLPARGRYRVALWLRGPGAGPWLAVAAAKSASEISRVALKQPSYGTVELAVRARAGGRFVPAKLLFEPRGGKRGVDLGNDGGPAARRSLYLYGRARLRLAPGRYRVLASRGFEHDVARATLRVEANKRQRLELVVPRVLATPGWLAADLHVHSASSFDSPTPDSVRLLAAAAVGLELIANTNHNAVRDDGKLAAARRLRPFVQSWPGQEVTTSGHRFGHFNAFPLRRALAYRHTTPKRLFAAARRAGALLQVNHPRMGSIGYFGQMAFDPSKGRARSGQYNASYPLLEVFNADYVADPAHVARNLREWLALLARGYRYTATGNSDAHRLPVQDYGYPRNMILWRRDQRARDRDDARAPRAKVIAALRAGHSYVTSGPLIDLTVDGKPLGATVQLRGSRPARVELTVRAADWVDVRHVEIVVGGKRWKRFTLKRRRRARRRARSSRPRRRGALARAGVRLRKTLRLPASVLPRKRSFVVVVVRGDRRDPTQPYRAIRPLAFTNPIYLRR